MSLEAILRKTLDNASTHARNVYGQNPLTANEVVELANSRALTIAGTVKPNGKPHLSPTDIVSVNGSFYLGVDEATARYRNLKQNPAVVIMLAEGRKRQAILEGTVTFLDMKSGTARKVLEAQKTKYGWVTDNLAEFRPEKAFTWRAK